MGQGRREVVHPVELSSQDLFVEVLHWLPPSVGMRVVLWLSWLVVELDPLVGVTCVAQEMLELRRCLRTHLLPALRVLVEQSSVAPDPYHLLMVLNHHLPSCWAVRGRSRETLFLGQKL